MTERESRIEDYIRRHEDLRGNGVNLIASENFLSKRASQALGSDLAGRYHNWFYGGSEYSRRIIEETEALARKAFRVNHALVTPLSGNICDLVAIFAFSKSGDRVAMPHFTVGGYPLGLEKFDRVRVDIPIDESTWEYNLGAVEKTFERENVRLCIAGASYIPFPHPLRELRTIADDLGFELVFDGAHVMGLIACGEFQKPLEEGASVLFGSTHKTLYGPQGGVMLTNSDMHAQRMRQYLDLDLETGIGLVDNPHVNRIAALGITLEELLYDGSYAKRVIKNARYLAKALEDNGVPMRFSERGYTGSHQIFMDIDSKLAERLCRELERQGIFIDIAGRIGLAEVTRKGWGETELNELADRITHVFKVVNE